MQVNVTRGIPTAEKGYAWTITFVQNPGDYPAGAGVVPLIVADGGFSGGLSVCTELVGCGDAPSPPPSLWYALPSTPPDCTPCPFLAPACGWCAGSRLSGTGASVSQTGSSGGFAALVATWQATFTSGANTYTTNDLRFDADAEEVKAEVRVPACVCAHV